MTSSKLPDVAKLRLFKLKFSEKRVHIFPLILQGILIEIRSEVSTHYKGKYQERSSKMNIWTISAEKNHAHFDTILVLHIFLWV